LPFNGGEYGGGGSETLDHLLQFQFVVNVVELFNDRSLFVRSKHRINNKRKE